MVSCFYDHLPKYEQRRPQPPFTKPLQLAGYSRTVFSRWPTSLHPRFGRQNALL